MALKAFADQTGADELMITSQIFDHGARVRAYEILTDAYETLSQQQPDLKESSSV